MPAGASPEQAADAVTHAAALMLLPGTPLRPASAPPSSRASRARRSRSAPPSPPR
ncbi:hypothetical protein [Nannocystis pusilla]|uniref:hypothetical protein n=1 Tax=Nannocystis pusilla TaxID=889268 RepID=UPI003B7EEBDB